MQVTKLNCGGHYNRIKVFPSTCSSVTEQNRLESNSRVTFLLLTSWFSAVSIFDRVPKLPGGTSIKERKEIKLWDHIFSIMCMTQNDVHCTKISQVSLSQLPAISKEHKSQITTWPREGNTLSSSHQNLAMQKWETTAHELPQGTTSSAFWEPRASAVCEIQIQNPSRPLKKTFTCSLIS